jgi:esterase/lipase superfamily enzyme
MAAKYWMITNRNVRPGTLGASKADLSFWVADGAGPLDQLGSWARVTQATFRAQLVAEIAGFPALAASGASDIQQHVTLFVHGYNTAWQDAVASYQALSTALFTGDQGLGTLILFTWPSQGSPLAYLADRQEVDDSAADLADVLTALYDYLQVVQAQTIRNVDRACRAKTSIIAHSLGNYLVQKAAHTVWTRKNQPLLVSLVNQLLMVAADVDNDLFAGGEQITKSDGDALANLSYRITALYSGLDQVLGASAGLKHFGKRRLGRSGLDLSVAHPDNVWEIDCTPIFEAEHADERSIHGAYLTSPGVRTLMGQVLRGVDRGILTQRLQLRSNVAPGQPR